MTELVEALLAPVRPTVDVRSALNVRDGWDRAEGANEGGGTVSSSGSSGNLLREPAGRAVADDDSGAGEARSPEGVPRAVLGSRVQV